LEIGLKSRFEDDVTKNSALLSERHLQSINFGFSASDLIRKDNIGSKGTYWRKALSKTAQ
jgi:hypothetical protein